MKWDEFISSHVPPIAGNDAGATTPGRAAPKPAIRPGIARDGGRDVIRRVPSGILLLALSLVSVR